MTPLESRSFIGHHNGARVQNSDEQETLVSFRRPLHTELYLRGLACGRYLRECEAWRQHRDGSARNWSRRWRVRDDTVARPRRTWLDRCKHLRDCEAWWRPWDGSVRT